MTDSRPDDDTTFEMLWDCRYCRTPKLLGLTHRHCPVCGAPQNAAERYFPSDADKVRVSEHRYVGRDVVCAHCGTFNSRSSRHCRDCGAPTEAGREAPLVVDAPRNPVRLAADVNPKRAGFRALWLVLSLLVVAATSLAVFFLWKRDAVFEVTGQQWERSIDVERYGPARETSWCDQMPTGGREVRRYRAVRSQEKIPDGETCTTRRVDQGDGTYKEVKDCKPRFRTRDIEGERCDYEVQRWSVVRSLSKRGDGRTPEPSWPDASALHSCARTGCERPGRRHEVYKVSLRGPNGDETCDVPLAVWVQMKPGERYSGRVRVIGDGLDCSSLSGTRN